MTASPTFRSGLATTLAFQALLYTAAIATNTIVGRVLGPDGLGLYALANTFVVLSALVLGGGLQFANPYFVGQDPGRLRAIIRATGAWVSAVGFLVVITAVIGGHSILLGALVDVRGWQALVIMGVLPVFLVHQNAQMILLGLRRFLAYNLVPVAVIGTTLLGVIVFVVLGHRGTDGLVEAWAIANIATAIGASVVVGQLMLSSPSKSVRLRELFAVGGRAVIANVLTMVAWRGDLFLLQGLGERSAVGLYVAAVSISEVSLKVPIQVGAVLFPFVSAERPVPGALLAARALRHTIAGVCGICLALGLFARPILLLLYGADYEPGHIVLLALLPGMVMWSVQVILGSYFAGRGYPQITYFSPLLAIAADVVLNVLLVPKWSALGTAVAASASYTIWALCLLAAFLRETRITIGSVLVLNYEDIRTALRQGSNLLRKLGVRR